MWRCMGHLGRVGEGNVLTLKLSYKYGKRKNLETKNTGKLKLSKSNWQQHSLLQGKLQLLTYRGVISRDIGDLILFFSAL